MDPTHCALIDTTKAIEALKSELTKMDERCLKSEATRERQNRDQFAELQRQSRDQFDELRVWLHEWLQALAAGTEGRSPLMSGDGVIVGEKTYDPDHGQLMAAWKRPLRVLTSTAAAARLPNGSGRASPTRGGTTAERELYARARTLDTEDVEKKLDLVKHQVGSTGQRAKAKNAATTKWYISHPYSLLHGLWDIFIAAILLLTFVLMPLNFFDDIADSLAVFNNVIDGFFMRIYF